MLGWSLNLFRIRGILLSVHFSFFIFLAFIAQRGWDEAGATGLIWSVATLVTFFTCVVLHELGHSFTAMHYGIGVRRILLMPIGGMAEMDDIPRQPRREFLITLAGPLVNFAIAAVLWAVLWQIDLPEEVPAYSAAGFASELLLWNLAMGIFNLLPALPMDGGRMLRALLATRMPYLKATFVAVSVGKIITVVGALVALFWAESLLLAALFAFIFFAGEMEYRAAKRREIEDAHWRTVLARVYARAPAPLAEQPPVLLR